MDEEKVIYLSSEEELEDFRKGNNHILYFSSESCNVCHSVFPKLVELAEGYEIRIGRIDVNKNVKIAGQHLIFSIPTILVFNEGKEVLRESRFIDFGNVGRILEMLLG